MYYFDEYGWPTSKAILDRETEIAPPPHGEPVVGQPHPNFTGKDWIMVEYFDPPPLPAPPEDERLWWIDVGPFRDRFDKYGYPGLKLTVLAMCRTNDICYGVFADLQGRLYIDLKGRKAELLTALNMIAAELAIAGKPPMTPAMREAILSSPTTDAERYVKGLPDPVVEV